LLRRVVKLDDADAASVENPKQSTGKQASISMYFKQVRCHHPLVDTNHDPDSVVSGKAEGLFCSKEGPEGWTCSKRGEI